MAMRALMVVRGPVGNCWVDEQFTPVLKGQETARPLYRHCQCARWGVKSA